MHCNRTESFFQPCLGVSDDEWSVIVGSYFLGGFIGTSTTQLVERFIQPLHYLWGLNFVILSGIFLMSSFSNFIPFAIGRFLVGFAAGISWNIVPIYSSDTAHKTYRGSFGVIISLISVLSVITSQVLGVVFSFHPGWRIYISLATITCIIQIISLPFVKRSPRLLIIAQKFEEAEKSLFALRGTSSHEDLKK